MCIYFTEISRKHYIQINKKYSFKTQLYISTGQFLMKKILPNITACNIFVHHMIT